MVSQEKCLQIHKRHLRQLTEECPIPWIDFSIAGNIPVQASTERPVRQYGDRDNNRSGAEMAKIRNSFSIFSSIFILEETTDWNSNALPEGVYVKN